jgi:hypothetical protein
MTTVSVQVPNWIKKEEAQREFLKNLLGKALLKMEFYRSKLKPYESKYHLAFEDFQKKVHSAPKEDFAQWDDLVEWEAFDTAFKEWEERYQELNGWLEKL